MKVLSPHRASFWVHTCLANQLSGLYRFHLQMAMLKSQPFDAGVAVLISRTKGLMKYLRVPVRELQNPLAFPVCKKEL